MTKELIDKNNRMSKELMDLRTKIYTEEEEYAYKNPINYCAMHVLNVIKKQNQRVRYNETRKAKFHPISCECEICRNMKIQFQLLDWYYENNYHLFGTYEEARRISRIKRTQLLNYTRIKILKI